MITVHGHVTDVAQEVQGSEATFDLGLGEDTILWVADLADFDETGGQVLVNGTVLDYAGTVGDDGTTDRGLTLVTANAVAVAVGDRIDVWNPATDDVVSEWVATVVDDLDGSAMQVPLAHALIDMLGAGVQGIIGVSVSCELDDTGQWTVTQILGKRPAVDGGFIDPGSDLVVDGGLVINGADNNVNGDMVLSSGIAAPITGAQIAFNRKATLDLFEGHTFGSATFIKRGLALTSDGSEYITTINAGATRTVAFASSATGAYTRQRSLVSQNIDPLSVCRAGSSYWVAGRRWNGTLGRYEIRVHRYHQDTGNLISSWFAVTGLGGIVTDYNNAGQVAIAHDATNNTIWIAYRTGTGELTFREYNVAGDHQQVIPTGVMSSAVANGLYVGPADIGTESIWVQLSGGSAGDLVGVWNKATGARTSTHDFAHGHLSKGLLWDGTRFKQTQTWGESTAAKLYEFSTNLDTHLEAAITWYDADSSGTGHHETTPSDRSVATSIPKRNWVSIATPAPPYNGTADGANAVRLYTTDTPGGDLRLLQTRTSLSGVNQWLIEARTDPDGDLPPVDNDFNLSGNAGRILTSDGGFWVDGSSDGDVGAGGFAASILEYLSGYHRCGTELCNPTAADTFTVVAVALTPPMAVTPKVTLTPRATSGAIDAHVSDVTESGFAIRFRSDSDTDTNVDWIASAIGIQSP